MQIKGLESPNTKGTVDRKLNVAISRAEEHLIMLGYPPALKTSRFYLEVLDRIQEKGGVLEM